MKIMTQFDESIILGNRSSYEINLPETDPQLSSLVK